LEEFLEELFSVPSVAERTRPLLVEAAQSQRTCNDPAYDCTQSQDNVRTLTSHHKNEHLEAVITIATVDLYQ